MRGMGLGVALLLLDGCIVQTSAPPPAHAIRVQVTGNGGTASRPRNSAAGAEASAGAQPITWGGRGRGAVDWPADRSSLGFSWLGGGLRSTAIDVSDDGSVVVGYFSVWSRGKTVLLGAVPGKKGSMAYAISPDGTVIVGRSGGNTAFLWESGIMTDLGRLPGFDRCAAHAVSLRGERVVGSCWRQAPPGTKTDGGPTGHAAVFVWDRKRGMRNLGRLLVTAGLLNHAGALDECFGISADGISIVGDGNSGRQRQEAWLAPLPMEE